MALTFHGSITSSCATVEDGKAMGNLGEKASKEAKATPFSKELSRDVYSL